MDTIYIILLNYNDEDNTIACISALKKSINVKYKLIVVDNNSNENCIKKIKNFLANGDIFIESNLNKGYAFGNNIGIKYALEDGAKIICIINSDCFVKEDTLEKLLFALLSNKNVGVVAPILFNYNSNEIQSMGISFDWFRIRSRNLTNPNFLSKNINVTQVEFLSGAMIMFKADLITTIGYLPEEYYLYFEEIEWEQRIKNIGRKLFSVNTASAFHINNATTSNVAYYYSERNRILFLRRNQKNKIMKFVSLLYIFCSSIIKCIIYKSFSFEELSYYLDGLYDRVNDEFRLK